MTGRGIVIVIVLVALQVTAFVVWQAVEEERTPDEPFAAERISGRAPRLKLQHSDGTTSSLDEFRGCPALLHFWASWCSPCRDELPAVMDLRIEGLNVIAAAINDTWPAMSQLTDTRSRSIVRVLEDPEARRFGISELPVTFLIDSKGMLVERYQGARDWSSDRAREHLEQVLGNQGDCSERVERR